MLFQSLSQLSEYVHRLKDGVYMLESCALIVLYFFHWQDFSASSLQSEVATEEVRQLDLDKYQIQKEKIWERKYVMNVE